LRIGAVVVFCVLHVAGFEIVGIVYVVVIWTVVAKFFFVIADVFSSNFVQTAAQHFGVVFKKVLVRFVWMFFN
jgi:hypothetical protein